MSEQPSDGLGDAPQADTKPAYAVLSCRQEVVRGVIIAVLLIAAIGVIGLSALDPKWIVGGPASKVTGGQQIRIGLRPFVVLALECRDSFAHATTVWQVPDSGLAVPGLFVFGRTKVAPHTITTTVARIGVLPAPPPAATDGWEARIYLWPLIVLLLAYPALALMRFVRHRQPRPLARRLVRFVLALAFSVSAGVSLLTCMGVAAVWYCSTRWSWHLQTNSTSFRQSDRETIGTSLFFASSQGVMGLGRIVSRHARSVPMAQVDAEHEDLRTSLWREYSLTMVAKPADTWPRRLGFAFARGGSDSGPVPYAHWWIGLPGWLLLPATAVLPVAWLGWFRRRRRMLRRLALGQCIGCGYDVRGNVSGICPECGGRIASSWSEV